MQALHRADRLPPGPRSFRPAGPRSRIRRDVLGFYRELAREYPRIASFRVFWIQVVSIFEPELIHGLLRRGPEDVRQSRSLRGLRVALGDGLLTSEGETWREERRRVQPAFRHDRLRSYGPTMVRHAAEAAAGWSDGGAVDLHAEMSRLTLRIAAEALFGTRLSGEVAEIGSGLGQVMDRFEEAFIRNRLPLPFWLPLPGNLRLRRAVAGLHDVADRLIARRLVEGGGEGADDLLSDLVAAARAEGTLAARRRLRDEVLTLLTAGHETTALALTWALWQLGRHPGEQERVADELREVLGVGRPDAPLRAPTVDDLPRLPRVRRVVQEAIRLHPPAWGTGREAVRDLEIDGWRIPKGAQIFVLQWVTHRDPRYFSEPDRFRPDRWLPDAPTGPDGAPAATRDAWFPFGAGPRACVGAGFALMEAPLVLATLLRDWRVEVPDGVEPELQPAVTLRPRGGVPGVVRRR